MHLSLTAYSCYKNQLSQTVILCIYLQHICKDLLPSKPDIKTHHSEDYGYVYCYMNPVIFKYCDGKRNKIRWLKVYITIRTEKPPWCAAYCYNTEETKGR